MSKIADLRPVGLRDLETLFAGKTLERVYVYGGNMLAFRFTDGSILDLATAAERLADSTLQIRALKGYQEKPS